ncbi:class I SAM-dependent methyltransferase [Fontimonas sp. SYSU GA230001]|uniref:class I SAM-dependent methyltransferase n=1 Tax=Fontimonas sp. SYSU GA230001 TaxID=3142450 RepID=UPI0032B36226
MRSINPLKMIRYGLSGFVPGGRYYCVCCRHSVRAFMPYRSGGGGVAPLMQSVRMAGSDVDHFECPRCGAHDRERHLLLYMTASGLLQDLAGKHIVHFAPEKRLPLHLARMKPASYILCDLYPTRPEIRQVDLLDMPFASESVDLLIANHVLEHVADDSIALREIFRVLRSGGMAILQTPYSQVLERTWCDPGITDPQARFHAYGQEDHVRLYGKDIFDRIASSGLIPDIATHEELLPDIDALKFGVNPEEPFFRFRRG